MFVLFACIRVHSRPNVLQFFALRDPPTPSCIIPPESMPITRRTFLYSAAAMQSRPRQPNILLLLADNWAWPHASCYHDPVIQTPTFDRLAKEGVVFTHSFAPNPSCSPSRSQLLSGQDAHRLGEAASLYGNMSSEVPQIT